MMRWLLGGNEAAATEQQNAVIETLSQLLRATIAQSPELPPSINVETFCSPREDGSFISKFKESLSGPDDRAEPSGDEVLDTLRGLARTAYPQLLLPPGPYRMSVRVGFWLPEFKAFLLAARADTTLTFTRSWDDVEPLDPSHGGFIESGFAEKMILAAWQQARLKQARTPSLRELYQQLEVVLGQVRLGCEGKDFEVVYLASLTGITVPADQTIEVGSVRIRAVRDGDHPGFLQNLAEQQMIAEVGDGSDRTVVISDAGDVIVEIHCPARVVFKRDERDRVVSWQIRPKINHEPVIAQVRLASLLSSDRNNLPVVLPVWSMLVDPFVSGGLLASWRSPQGFASRTPIELTRSEMDQWAKWLERLAKVNLAKLGVAPARLLRAVAERTDFADALVDAVIVWEALFGDKIETTFKVTTAIVRLLGTSPEDRRAIKKEVADLYNQRSLIVHGQDGATDQQDTSRRAIALSIRCLRTLVENRPDLIAKTSGERVQALVVLE